MNRLSRLVWVLWCGLVVACVPPPDLESGAAPPEEPWEARASVKREAVVVPAGPDLQVMSLAASFTAVQRHASRTVGVTVCNHGTEAAPPFPVSVVVSTNTTINASDPVVGTATFPVLAPAACHTASVTSVFSPAMGTYHLAAWADRADGLNEEVEANNILRSGTVYIGNRADVTVSVLAAPVSAQPNTVFTAQLRACNTGSVSASSTVLSLRRSTDTTINTSDPSMGSASIGALAAQACQDVNVNGTSPALTERYLGAWVSTSSTEVTTANNSAVAGRFAVGNAGDLVVESASHERVGAALSTTVTVCNRGYVATAASQVDVLLSEDGAFDANDTLLGGAAVPALGAGACVALTLSHALPAMVAVRTPLVRLDPANGVTELFENNNVHAGAALSLGPDLQVTGFSFIYPGETQFFPEVVVCNVGSASAPASVVDVLQSEDQVADPGDAVVVGINIPALDAGACATRFNTFVLSAPGDFTFIARADGPNAVAESNEGNNLRSLAMNVAADLVITSTAIWAEYAAFAWNVRVCNQGNLSMPAGPVVEVRESADTTFDLEDPLLTTTSLPALHPGACTDLIGSSGGWPSYGTRRVVVAVDVGDAVVESNEANNTAASDVVFVGPDITLEQVDTTYAWDGALDMFTVAGSLCNAGTIGDTLHVEAVLSSDDVRDFDDQELWPQAYEGIWPEQGGCTPFSVPFTMWPLPQGTFKVLVEIVNDRTGERELVPTGPFSFGADIVLSDVNVATTWNGNTNEFTFTAQACNVGTHEGFGVLGARLSSDTVVDPFDTVLSSHQYTQVFIAPRACVPVGGVFSAYSGQVGDGTHFAFLELVNSGDLNAANNTAMAPSPVVLGSDVAVSDVTVAVSWNGNANEFSFTGQACNVGTRPASVTSGARLSTDAILDYSDVFLGGGPGLFLQPGECAPLNDTFAPWSQVPDGTYFAFLEVWSEGDLNTANNAAMAPVAVTLGSDVVVSDVTVAVSWNGYENVFSLTAQACNVGTRPASVSSGARLSTDAILDYSDVVLGGGPGLFLLPGDCAPLNDTFAPWSQVPDGTYFAFLEVWSEGDLNTANNAAMASTAVTLGPDVTVSTVDATVSWNGPDPVFHFSAQVCNVGTRPVSASASARLSTDTVPDHGDAFLSSGINLFLLPGECTPLSGPFSAWSPVPAGTYYAFLEVMVAGDPSPTNNVAMDANAVTF